MSRNPSFWIAALSIFIFSMKRHYSLIDTIGYQVLHLQLNWVVLDFIPWVRAMADYGGRRD